MLSTREGRIVETPDQARQAEVGPSVLVLLLVSVRIAALVLLVMWAAFFISESEFQVCGGADAAPGLVRPQV